MSIIWELDFYSRPILDENQKKVWEVLICESPLASSQLTEELFQYSSWCPNQQVNSIWLREALEDAIAKRGETPKKIRFFRRQMANMITKACQELDIPAQATRRTYWLNRCLNERMESVYPHQPGYDPSAAIPSFVQYQPPIPKPLPDAIQGEQWTFVTLDVAAFDEMPEWEIDFGEAFPLSLIGLPPDTRIPGIIIFSERAKALAAWMSGLELAFIRIERNATTQVLLETGASESWILDTLKNPQTLSEAQGFETAKAKAQQVHFLAVQSSPTAETFAGFWLLQELKLGISG